MKKILIIVGPTATGKTDLALKLAKKFNGELVACDSRQVYKGLDIGTGKMPSQTSEVGYHQKSDGFWKIQGTQVWMYDLVFPTQQFNAFDWSRKALRVIGDIWGRGNLPIIVGGTGLYLKALLEGLDSLPPVDSALRAELEKLSLAEMQGKVATLSPARWEKLNQSDQKNLRRLIRILEQVTMYPYINKYPKSNIKFPISNVLKLGLTAPRPWLNSRIDQRVFVWFNQGILNEVQGLINRGVPIPRFKELGLEYGLIADYLNGKISSQEKLIELIQTKVRQYAKRQMTWFKKEKDVVWFNVNEEGLSHKVEDLVQNWYNESEKQ